MEQAADFLAESEALWTVLKNLDDENFERPTTVFLVDIGTEVDPVGRQVS